MIRAALDYLRSFVPTSLSDIGQVFDAVARNIPWLDGSGSRGTERPDSHDHDGARH